MDEGQESLFPGDVGFEVARELIELGGSQFLLSVAGRAAHTCLADEPLPFLDTGGVVLGGVAAVQLYFGEAGLAGLVDELDGARSQCVINICPFVGLCPTLP